MNEDISCLACMCPPNMHAKRLMLVDLITTYSEAGKTIVFCNTKRECEVVVSGISAIMPAEALHGDIAQDMREFTMGRFREVRVPPRSRVCLQFTMGRFREVFAPPLFSPLLSVRALPSCSPCLPVQHPSAVAWLGSRLRGARVAARYVCPT